MIRPLHGLAALMLLAGAACSNVIPSEENRNAVQSGTATAGSLSSTGLSGPAQPTGNGDSPTTSSMSHKDDIPNQRFLEHQ
jgi:hypothetical protein